MYVYFNLYPLVYCSSKPKITTFIKGIYISLSILREIIIKINSNHDNVSNIYVVWGKGGGDKGGREG